MTILYCSRVHVVHASDRLTDGMSRHHPGGSPPGERGQRNPSSRARSRPRRARRRRACGRWLDVGLDRVERDKEGGADLALRELARQEPEHRQLALGHLLDACAPRRARAGRDAAAARCARASREDPRVGAALDDPARLGCAVGRRRGRPASWRRRPGRQQRIGDLHGRHAAPGQLDLALDRGAGFVDLAALLSARPWTTRAIEVAQCSPGSRSRARQSAARAVRRPRRDRRSRADRGQPGGGVDHGEVVARRSRRVATAAPAPRPPRRPPAPEQRDAQHRAADRSPRRVATLDRAASSLDRARPTSPSM